MERERERVEGRGRDSPRLQPLYPPRAERPDRLDLDRRGPSRPGAATRARPSQSDAKLAQTLDRLQPCTAAFPQDSLGQLAFFGTT